MKIMPKAEIYRRMDRYHADPKKTVSMTYFAELAGLGLTTIKAVFIDKTMPMSEHTQIAVSRALERLARGDVTIVHYRDRSRKMIYNTIPKPKMVRGTRINLGPDGFKLEVGVRNKQDYSAKTLREKLKGD